METMYNPGDHAMGLELEIVELVERQRTAARFGRTAEMASLAEEIGQLQSDLAATAALAAILAQPATSSGRRSERRVA